MLLKITETMKLKDIMELDPRLEEKLMKMGLGSYLNVNEPLEKVCINKGLPIEVALKELNDLVGELKIFDEVLHKKE